MSETCARMCEGNAYRIEIRRLEDTIYRHWKERDAMLVQLEALGWPCQLAELPEHYRLLCVEIERLRAELAALKAQSKPVAYRMFDDFSAGDWEYNATDEFSFGRTGGQPLYTHPQPADAAKESK